MSVTFRLGDKFLSFVPRMCLSNYIVVLVHTRLGSLNLNKTLFNKLILSSRLSEIYRSPKYFEPILNYLRTGNLIIDPNVSPEGVLEEARYYGIDSIIPKLESMTKTTSLPR